jgi:methylenetetrahydrofolate--tRNA-(uracil-5-)-methyltransferase
MNNKVVNVIGGGLAGTSAAYFLANKGVKVNLYDQKPNLVGPFHSTKLGELVCSNSLKSEAKDNACGLLKAEIEKMGSLFIQASKYAKIPSGSDLAVDRELFSSFIDDKIRNHPNINVISSKVTSFNEDEINIICTGPLSDEEFLNSFKNLTGLDCFSFFDAAAPLVYFDSLDTSKMYYKSRFDKGEGKYLNIPLTKEEYYQFNDLLVNAQRVELHDFDHFEGCLPIEVMASRGPNTLRCGPLQPKGLKTDAIDPYAVIQLRKDDVGGHLYGMVGFQTNLTYKEQKRVFSSLKGMENAKFARFGLMHRNSYLNAPKCLNRDLSIKGHPNIFIGGQFSGVEGYVESAATGLLAAYYAYMRLNGKQIVYLPLNTMLASLVNYLVMTSSKNFAPINACYGILQAYDKREKLSLYDKSLESISNWLDQIKL